MDAGKATVCCPCFIILFHLFSWFPGRRNEALNFLYMELVLMTPSLHLALLMLIIRGMCAAGSMNTVFNCLCKREACF